MSVSQTAATSAYLGTIAFGGSASTVFNAGGGDFLVIMVSYSYGAGSTPVVSFGGVLASPTITPRVNDVNLGGGAVYVLKSPASGAQNLTVLGGSYLGTVQITAVAFSTDGQFINVRQSLVAQSASPQTISVAGVANGSAVFASAFCIYSVPTSMTPSTHWNQVASSSGSSGYAGAAFAYTQLTQIDIPFQYSLTLTPSSYAQFIVMAVEIVSVGVFPPSPAPIINNFVTANAGTIGVTSPTNFGFNCAGGSLLVVALSWGQTVPPPTVTYGGVKLNFLKYLTIVTSGSSGPIGTTVVAVLNNPPQGNQNLALTGYVGFFGQVMVSMLSVSGASGVAGVFGTEYSGGYETRYSYAASNPLSLLVSFLSSNYAFGAGVASDTWTTIGNASYSSAESWTCISTGGPAVGLDFLQNAYSQTQLVTVELIPTIQSTPDVVGSLSISGANPSVSSGGTEIPIPTNTGQVYQMNLETFFRNGGAPWSEPQPGDFDLANLPPYVDMVILDFGFPLCTYSGVNSNVKETTGLNWYGSATLLQQTIALLKSRSPNTKVLFGVQQSTPEQYKPEPYDPTGWGGMTTTNVAAMVQFVQDMNMDGIFIDYECFSNNTNLDHHCQLDPSTGLISCYTDTEYISVIKAIRTGLDNYGSATIRNAWKAATGLPRYQLYMYGVHVGCYGEYPFANAQPPGYNSGFCLAVARDPVAVAALDCVHLGAYDAGGAYDPRIALDAFQYYYPTVPICLGLRVGPPDYGGFKQTLQQMIGFTNATMMQNAKGVFLYALEWPLVQPSGNISSVYPDSNMASYTIAKQLGLSGTKYPLVSVRRNVSGPNMTQLKSALYSSSAPQVLRYDGSSEYNGVQVYSGTRQPGT